MVQTFDAKVQKFHEAEAKIYSQKKSIKFAFVVFRSSYAREIALKAYRVGWCARNCC